MKSYSLWQLVPVLHIQHQTWKVVQQKHLHLRGQIHRPLAPAHTALERHLLRDQFDKWFRQAAKESRKNQRKLSNASEMNPL